MSLVFIPLDVQEIILQQKKVLETETYQSFIDCFDVRLFYRTKLPLGKWSTEQFCDDKLFIHYKPLGKVMIITTHHRVSVPETPYFIIAKLLLTTNTLYTNCPDVKITTSYSDYCAKISGTPLSEQEFCECKQFKEMMGDRYDRLWDLMLSTVFKPT